MDSIAPSSPFLSGPFAPFNAEMDAPDLQVRGRLPDDLRGTFYRNGPNPRFMPHPDDPYHWFDGDGMVYAFHFAGGRVSLRNRWVRTPKFLAEAKAGRRLFGVFGNPRFNDPAAAPGDYDTANTHIWPHAGRLFALMEGKPPTELDPETLETIGYEHFAGAVNGPFTAHPKQDPQTGELFGFGWGAKGLGSTALRYNIIAADGGQARTEWLEQPYCSMMHDMVLTENFVVFPCLPLTVSLQRAMQGKPPAAWEADKPAYFGVLPRYGAASEITWIEADPRFAYHVANAFERDGEIVIDVAGSAKAPLMADADGNRPTEAESRLVLKQWVVGRDRKTVRDAAIDDMGVQFPRIDDRRNGRDYRYIYVNGAAKAGAARLEGFDTVSRFDRQRNARDDFTVAGGYFGEPVFVPKADAAAEDAGYVLALLYQPELAASALLVFDAAGIANGPVAEIIAPARIPMGFHCHWRAG
jgi:carotenoid cleavage dioxygenase